VTPGQRSLRTQIQLTVKRDGGCRIEDLAEQTGASLKDTKAVVWALVAAGTLDWCAGWVVFAPRQTTRRAS
jgi:hypothetical protein